MFYEEKLYSNMNGTQTNKNVTGIIYHAFDIRSGKSYVGQTWGTLESRQGDHLRGSKKKAKLFQNVLRKRPDDFVWSILTHGLTTQHDMDSAESYWGIYFDAIHPGGYCLRLGSANGKMSAETRAKISNGLLGKRKGVKTKPHTQEHRDKISAALKGRPRSERFRINISKALKGKKKSPDAIAKVAAKKRGVPLSAEHREKLSKILKGRRRSPEVIAKIAATRAKCPPEHGQPDYPGPA